MDCKDLLPEIGAATSGVSASIVGQILVTKFGWKLVGYLIWAGIIPQGSRNEEQRFEKALIPTCHLPVQRQSAQHRWQWERRGSCGFGADLPTTYQSI